MAYNRDLDNVLEYLGEMSTDARLWIFQSERQLSPQEESAIEEHLGKFLSQWTSHNRALLARGAVAYGHFVIVALDESKSSAASGCSIDAMTHQIQGMSKALGLNLMDRTTFYFLKQGKLKGIHMNQLSEAFSNEVVSYETPVFNNLVKQKSDLQEQWLVPLEQSWHKRFV